jgi:dipeptidyl aminopeptidase/acylaminoacyl peptidase
MRIRNILWKSLRWTGCLLFMLAPKMSAQASLPEVTINDLVERTLIEKASISPNGRFVAFLTAKGLPTLNCYEVETRIISSTPHSKSALLDRSRIRPEEVFDADSGTLLPSAGTFVWSRDARRLIFTRRRFASSEALALDMTTAQKRLLLQTKGWIDVEDEGGDVRLIDHHMAAIANGIGTRPRDVSVQVSEAARFVKPFDHPSYFERAQSDEWLLRKWETTAHRVSESAAHKGQEAGRTTQRTPVEKTADAEVYVGESLQEPIGHRTANLEWISRNRQDPMHASRSSRIMLEPEHRILAPETDPACFYSLVGWSSRDHDLIYIRKDREQSYIMRVDVHGNSHVVLNDPASFVSLAGPHAGPGQAEFAVFTRSTNLMPDELVMVDLRSGYMHVLFAPNASFAHKQLPEVQLISIPGSPMYGRLYLPEDRSPGQRLPLVFTGYMSGPGFEASVGDELPVFLLVSHGIAVFAMNEYGANVPSNSGNFDFELSRIARPLHAMEFIRHQLAIEGIIDPARCGVAGVSYGSEIAMYAYWNAQALKAVSVATASWGPMEALLAGTGYGEFLKQRGFPSIEHPEDAKWKALSASFNARQDLPPLLLQSSSDEDYFGNVEMWMQLHRVHASVSWYSYPHEGHVKRSPANKWWVYKRNLDWFRHWLLPDESSSAPNE